MLRLVTLSVILLVGACGGAEAPAPAVPAPVPASAEPESSPPAADLQRPIPAPVNPPPSFVRAVERSTRTATGRPGNGYWQQWAEYTIDTRVDTDAKTLTGSETIVYHNNAPVGLPVLVVNLLQNFHAEGVERLRPAQVTGGMVIERVTVNGGELGPTTTQQQPGWEVDGTVMYVVPRSPVAAGGRVELSIDWSFPIPQAGASGRMGHHNDELLYLAYWYPQMATFDDVIGWHVEPFRGNAEFYSGFASYDLSIDAPAGWLVMSTGTLMNPEEVLQADVAERLRSAGSSDERVRVVTHQGTHAATAQSPDGRLVWQFRADSVRDVAFSVTRNHAWDAARTPVGDRDGDGEPEYARVDAFWRSYSRYYDEAWRYAQHAIEFLSGYTGLPYAWPHMTVVEGGGIIGGGMEFPMMTLIGDYNRSGADALYNVTAHELAHMWLPMMVSMNERRYAWFDEGTTSFLENNARADFRPDADSYSGDQRGYLSTVASGLEGAIMTWSDFHRPGPAYGTASYAKPSSVLHALRGVLGEDTFDTALREFFQRWAFKHPYPWDLFNTFEDVAGRDLDWFWRSWYYESAADGDRWFLDQSVESVERLTSGETRITIRDRGWIPMPVHLTITRSDGSTLERTIPVDRWLQGADRASITIPDGPAVTRVVIDAAGAFPDIDERNDTWEG
jgi:hypothetical protein